MNKIISVLVLFAVVGICVACGIANADPSPTALLQVTSATCSNSTLKGDFGTTVGGSIAPPPNNVFVPQAGVAMMHFDGIGGFTQSDFIVINGLPSPGHSVTASGEAVFETGETGTYTVNSDCTGSATINFPGGRVINLAFVIASQGREWHSVVTQILAPSPSGTVVVPAAIRSDGVKLQAAAGVITGSNRDDSARSLWARLFPNPAGGATDSSGLR
jgi:hypothetical protein